MPVEWRVRHHVFETERLRLEVSLAVAFQWDFLGHRRHGIADFLHGLGPFLFVVYCRPCFGIAVLLDGCRGCSSDVAVSFLCDPAGPLSTSITFLGIA